jgi:hypothetical protein
MAKIFKYILDFQGNTSKIQKDIGGLTSNLKGIAAAAGLAFGASEVIGFAKELINLSGVAEGVRSAFDKIGTTGDLDNMRKSVRGTVGDLDLMKRAVSAKNLGIPVQELGGLFAFAAKRAQDTGQSVDYLVDSIVMGIGRKSPLILDNLGISAIQLKEKLNGVALETASVGDITRAVGLIAQDSFKKTGDILDTNAIKIQNIVADWENFKLSIAENVGFNEFIGKEISALDDELTVLFGKHISNWEKFKYAIDLFDLAGQVQYLAQKERRLTEQHIAGAKAIDDYDRAIKQARAGTVTAGTATVTYGGKLEGLKTKLNTLKEGLDLIDATDKVAIATQKQKIALVEAQIKGITAVAEASKYQAGTIGALGEEITKLNEKFLMTNATDIESIAIIGEKITALERQKAVIASIASDPISFRTDSFGALPTARVTGKLNVEGSGKAFDTKATLNVDSLLKGMPVFTAAQEDMRAEMAATEEMTQTLATSFAGGFDQIGQSVVAGMGLAEDGLEGFVGGLAETAIKLISMFLAQALAAAITGASLASTFTGAAAIFTLPAYIAAGVAGVMGAFASIPAFAAGGIVSGPTLGLMGEYPGASTNPEIIAPLSKLKEMIGGNNQTIILQPSLELGYEGLRVRLNRVNANVGKRT